MLGEEELTSIPLDYYDSPYPLQNYALQPLSQVYAGVPQHKPTQNYSIPVDSMLSFQFSAEEPVFPPGQAQDPEDPLFTFAFSPSNPQQVYAPPPHNPQEMQIPQNPQNLQPNSQRHSGPSNSTSPDPAFQSYYSPQSNGNSHDSSTGNKHEDELDDDDEDMDSADKKFASKDARNAAERKRRARMNDTLGSLKEMVPSLAGEKKPSKALIYKKVVEYLGHVENQNKSLKLANEEMQQKLEGMKKVQEEAFQRMKEMAFATLSTSPIQQIDFETLIRSAKDNTSWTEVASGYGKFGLGHTPVVAGETLNKVTVWRKHSAISSISLTKASCVIQVPAETIVTVLLDLKGRKSWDASLIDVQSVGTHGVDLDEVFYVAVKSPSGLSNRDYVKVRRFKKLDNGAYAVIEKSTTHPNFPPKKGFVRGEVLLSGHLIEPVVGNPSCSHVTMLNEIDLKGSIPTPVVNFLTTKAPFSWFDAFSHQVKDCSGDLVHCLTTTILRIAIA